MRDQGPLCLRMEVGDYLEVRNSDLLTLPGGQPFCYWAIQSVLPLLPAKMLSAGRPA